MSSSNSFNECSSATVRAIGTLTLTGYQRDIWIAGAYLPRVPLFHVGGYQRLRERVDLEVLRACAIRALASNDVLRLRFG